MGNFWATRIFGVSSNILYGCIKMCGIDLGLERGWCVPITLVGNQFRV